MLLYARISTLFILIPSLTNAATEWKGNWFPVNPSADSNVLAGTRTMGISDSNCDNGQTNLNVDYDPRNASQAVVHMCLKDRSLYRSKYSVQPVMHEYVIPSEYSALHKCVNETIEYDYRLPTFGTHRKLWPIYGQYKYVPPQRWLHSLEHGAIVMLYHPCADLNQIDLLKAIVQKCLYRHIITASDLLEADRPLALVAWGRSLEMSATDESIVIGFIRMNALQGPEKISRDGQYNASLIEPAVFVSSNDDELLCPNM